MAKNIACPTCGETVPIPPGAAGTVIKCDQCGTPIKLVSRKKSGGAGAPEGSGVSSTGAYGGGMEDAGAWGDDPPALGECAQCGSVLADPSQLVEDRGRMICPNCAARSTVSAREDVHSYRPRAGDAAAAPVIGFSEPTQVVARHGPLITMNLATLGGALAGSIAIAATVWLTFNPRPNGTQDTSVKPAPVINVPPANPVQDGISAEKAIEIVATVNEATDLVKQNNIESLQLAQAKYQSVVDWVGQRVTTDPVVTAAIDTATRSVNELPERIKEMQEAESAAASPPVEIASVPPPTPTEPIVAPPPPKPEPVVEPATTEPASKPGIFWESAEEIIETPRLLAAGLRALGAEKYDFADKYFAKAIEQLPPPQAQVLPAEHQLAYHGRGAALIGLKDYRTADAALNRVYRGAPPTPSLIFNRAVVNYQLDQDRFESLDQVAGLLKAQPSEQAVDLLGAMLEKWRVNPEVKRKAEDIQSAALKQLEAQNGGRKRWSGRWVEQARYDELEGLVASIALLEKDLNAAEIQVRFAQSRYDRAVQSGQNAEAEKRSLEQWKETHVQKQASLDAIRAKLPERPADVGFKPVMPEVPAGMLLPEE